MNATRFSATGRTHSMRGAARKLTLGVLAATLAVTTALPAIAGDSREKRRGGEHRQEQDVSAEGRGKGKGRGNKTKTVKKTFSNDGAIAIPAAGSFDDLGPADPYPATIAVTEFKKAKISDVNVTLRSFSHTFPADTGLLLVAPGGRNAIVMADVGNPDGFDEEVTDITVTLDDEAAEVLPELALLTSGSFRPLDGDEPGPDGDLPDGFPAPAPSGNTALSTFDGINPNGQWQLFVVDGATEDRGGFAGGWTLEITAKVKTKNKKKR